MWKLWSPVLLVFGSSAQLDNSSQQLGNGDSLVRGADWLIIIPLVMPIELSTFSWQPDELVNSVDRSGPSQGSDDSGEKTMTRDEAAHCLFHMFSMLVASGQPTRRHNYSG